MSRSFTPTHRTAHQWQALADFRQTAMGRRPCKQKCGKCGHEWAKTGTKYVNLAMPKQPPFDHLYWCDGCAENNGK